MQKKELSFLALAVFLLGLSACREVSAPLTAPEPDWSNLERPKMPVITPEKLLQWSVITPPMRVSTPTYDGCNQAVHPSVLRLDSAWNGSRGWAAATPYCNGNSYLENAAIYMMLDSITWIVPLGVPNPFILAPGGARYNSDPDLTPGLFHNSLMMSNRAAGSDSNIATNYALSEKFEKSAGTLMVATASHNLISQSSTIGPDGMALYSVNAGPDGCKSRSISVERRLLSKDSNRYGDPQKVDLVQPGRIPWHIEVRWWESLKMFIALYPAFPASTPGYYGCLDDDLFLATSLDGVHFTTYPMPILSRKNVWHEYASLYRASGVYDAESDILRIWPSYLEMNNAWQVGYMAFNFHAALAALEAARAEGSSRPAYVDLERSDERVRVVLKRAFDRHGTP